MSLSLCPRWRNKMYLFIYLFYLSLFSYFFIICPKKKLLDKNYVEFDFTMGHVLVIFPFLWMENEKCKENQVHLPPPHPQKSIHSLVYKFYCCFRKSCGCSTVKSKTLPEETFWGSPPFLTTRDREPVPILHGSINRARGFEPEISDSAVRHTTNSTTGWIYVLILALTHYFHEI